MNKQIKLEVNKKEALENKLIKLQKQINRQIDEASEREEASINIGKESKLSDLNNNINKGTISRLFLFYYIIYKI